MAPNKLRPLTPLTRLEPPMVLVFETLPTPGYGNDGRWLTVYMVPHGLMFGVDGSQRAGSGVSA